MHRHEQDLTGCLAPVSARGPQPFAFPGTEPRYARDRRVDIRHVQIDVELDFATRSIEGRVTTDFAAIAEDVASVGFDAEEMGILGVTDGRRRLAFDHCGGRLEIALGSPLPSGKAARTVVHYRARPRLGLYFTGNDPAYPDTPVQAWTQGQDDDSRFWFPCVDYPNERASTEVRVTVPDTMTALSNGRLVSEHHDRARRRKTFHYRQDIPHVAYLVMIAAGEFSVVRRTWRGVPVEYWVARGREAEAMRSFRPTPRMLSFFSRETGLPYPYAKYAQICVADFIFGGMENTSATVLTDRTLHDRRAHLDFSSDGLVAHELAHQWFGDLLTCRDWSHGWLNEGFATYYGRMCEADLLESTEGPGTAARMIWELQEAYIEEGTSRYRRPIVTNEYDEPIQLFDAHLYVKGALVIHMLRRVVGDAAFRKAIRLYVQRHQASTVVTSDLQHAFEEATGRSLQEFFEQWVHKPGHPELEAAFTWDAARKTAAVTVRQKQDRSDGVPLFRFDLDIEFACGSRTIRKTVKVTRAEETYYVPLPRRPRRARIDPDHALLRALKFPRPIEMLVDQLRNDPRFSGKVEAIGELAREGSARAADAVAKAMRSDDSWAVRGRAAQALAGFRSADALNTLIRRVRAETHPKARRGVVGALGAFRGERRLLPLLQKTLDTDPSYFVCAEAAQAIGKLRDPDSFDILRAALDIPSWEDVIRCGAIRGLAALRDKRAIDLLIDAARQGQPQRSRAPAIAALGELAALQEPIRERERVREFLEELTRDPQIAVVSAAAEALATLGDPRAADALARVCSTQRNGLVRTRARRALRQLNEGKSREEALRRLRDDLDRLDKENRELRDRVARLEQPRTTAAGAAPRKPRTRSRTARSSAGRK